MKIIDKIWKLSENNTLSLTLMNFKYFLSNISLEYDFFSPFRLNGSWKQLYKYYRARESNEIALGLETFKDSETYSKSNEQANESIM